MKQQLVSLFALAMMSVVIISTKSVNVIAQPFGAIYHINNNNTNTTNTNNNVLLAYKLDVNGVPTFAAAYSTGGAGYCGGTSQCLAADPLISQDSVAVWGNYLLTVNAGSNTAVLFAISTIDPTQLTMLGVPMDTNGDFPIAVAFHPTGQVACVVNGGVRNGIHCFTVSATGLTPVSAWDRALGLPITATPTSPPGSVSDIQFSPDGNAILVTAKVANGLFIYPLSASSGTTSSRSLAATPIRSNPSSSVLPFSLTLIPNNIALITDPGAGGVSVFQYNSATGTTNAASLPLFPFNPAVVSVVCWSAYSNLTGSSFAVAAGSGTIAELSIQTNSSGSLNVSLLEVLAIPTAYRPALDSTIGTVNKRDVLYVAGSGGATTPATPAIFTYAIVAQGNLQYLGMTPVPAAYALRSMQGLAIWTPAASALTPTSTPTPTSAPTVAPTKGAASSMLALNAHSMLLLLLSIMFAVVAAAVM